MHSACKFWISMGALQQPRLSQASAQASQANQSDCQRATVKNFPLHNLAGYHIKPVVFAKSNGQQTDSGYGTCNVHKLEDGGKTEQPVLTGEIQ